MESADRAFTGLAEQYYDESGSLAADPRNPSANVWYWDPQTEFARPTAVPGEIFGSVMAMRCCEEALLINPSLDEGIALWLAAALGRRIGTRSRSLHSPADGFADARRNAFG